MLITSSSRPSLNAWLPTKAMWAMNALGPSVIWKTTSTRFWLCRMICGVTTVANRPRLA